MNRILKFYKSVSAYLLSQSLYIAEVFTCENEQIIKLDKMVMYSWNQHSTTFLTEIYYVFSCFYNPINPRTGEETRRKITFWERKVNIMKKNLFLWHYDINNHSNVIFYFTVLSCSMGLLYLLYSELTCSSKYGAICIYLSIAFEIEEMNGR